MGRVSLLSEKLLESFCCFYVCSPISVIPKSTNSQEEGNLKIMSNCQGTRHTHPQASTFSPWQQDNRKPAFPRRRAPWAASQTKGRAENSRKGQALRGWAAGHREGSLWQWKIQILSQRTPFPGSRHKACPALVCFCNAPLSLFHL